MDKLEQVQLALQRLADQRKRRKEEGRSASEHEEEEEDQLLSTLLSQLDSIKDSTSPLSSQAVEVNQKCEGREDEIQEVGAAEIMTEFRNVKRQNTVTHRLLSVMIIITAIWQLSEVSLLLSLKDKLSHPFRAAGNIVIGLLKGGQNLRDKRLNSTANNLLEVCLIPPIGVLNLSHVDLPSLPLSGGEDLKDKLGQPLGAAGNMIRGLLKDGGDLQDIERLTSTVSCLLQTHLIPPIGGSDLSHVDLPSLPLGGGKDSNRPTRDGAC